MSSPSTATANPALWTRTTDALPEEGVVVDVISEGGMQTQLLLRRGVWFLADESMYVYYGVALWKLP
jgi:hypothetical protein